MDLSKRFDRLYWRRACIILTSFGLPVNLVDVIGRFYDGVRLYVECQGAVDTLPSAMWQGASRDVRLQYL